MADYEWSMNVDFTGSNNLTNTGAYDGCSPTGGEVRFGSVSYMEERVRYDSKKEACFLAIAKNWDIDEDLLRGYAKQASRNLGVIQLFTTYQRFGDIRIVSYNHNIDLQDLGTGSFRMTPVY